MAGGFSGPTWGKVKKYVGKEIGLYLTTGATPMGSWDASTNTPTLTQGSGTVGQYYAVVVAGKWDNIDFLVGDSVIFSAKNKWERVPTGVEQDDTPMVVAFIDENTTNLPTSRISGKPLVIGDAVKVKSTATLPFTVGGITFDSYNDEAEWNGTAWQEKSYSAGKTNEVKVNNPTNESIDGTGDYQNDLNKKFTNIIGKNKTLDVSNKTNIIEALNYLALIDDITLERDTNGKIRLKVKTSADKDKVYKVQSDGTWNIENIREWKSVSTFSGLTPNDYTLYILTENITIDDVEYKKGFYTWDSTNGYVARSSVVEVDDITIDKDTNGKLEIKLEGIETKHIKPTALAKSTDNVRDYTNSVDSKLTTEKFLQKTLQNIATPVNDNDAVNKKYVDLLAGRVMEFKGFISSTVPTGTITEGSLWYESATLPTTYPINVKTYTSGVWSSTITEYTPNSLDLWSNLENGKGYYWFGNNWNLVDENVLVDNTSIDKNLQGKLEVKDSGITKAKLNSNVADNDTLELDATNGLQLKKHLYQHHFVMQYGDRVQYPNVTGSFNIMNTNAIAPTYSELASWLYTNGFTDKYKIYSISGVRTTVTRYVASTSGGTPTTSTTIPEVASGLYSTDGTDIVEVSNFSNMANVGDGRATTPPSNLYNIYLVATTQIL